MNGIFDRFIIAGFAALAVASPLFAFEGFESDRFDTGSGELEIIFISHATLAFRYGGKTIHVDPVG